MPDGNQFSGRGRGEEITPSQVAIEAERALLGALMMEPSTTASAGALRPDHFAEPLHGAMFLAITEAVGQKKDPDAWTIFEALKHWPSLQALGGVRYVADLVDQAPPAANVPDYAAAVTEAWSKRTFLELSAEAQREIRTGGVPSAQIMARVRREMEALEAMAAPEDASMVAAPEAAHAAVQAMRERAQAGKTRGKRTGLRCFDRRLGGLRPGAKIVIGGRPSMGKSSLARAAAHGAARENPNDLFLFLGIEMGPEEMMQRELSALTYEHGEFGDAVEYRAMGTGDVTPMELDVVERVRSKVPPNLILDDVGSLSVDDVRRKVWALKRRGNVGAVFIDYLQLMRRPPAAGRNDAAVLGEMTAALKQIARQAGTCVVLLSQLSRAVENRDDKRPQLADLRESGSIEQDADAVLFPYREFYYVERSEPKAGTSEHLDWEMRCEDLRSRLDVICAKQRQGPVGTDRQEYLAPFDFIRDVPNEH